MSLEVARDYCIHKCKTVSQHLLCPLLTSLGLTSFVLHSSLQAISMHLLCLQVTINHWWVTNCWKVCLLFNWKHIVFCSLGFTCFHCCLSSLLMIIQAKVGCFATEHITSCSHSLRLLLRKLGWYRPPANLRRLVFLSVSLLSSVLWFSLNVVLSLLGGFFGVTSKLLHTSSHNLKTSPSRFIIVPHFNTCYSVWANLIQISNI